MFDNRKEVNVIYEVLHTCTKVHIHETRHELVKEHKDMYIKGLMNTLAIDKYAWTEYHFTHWDGTGYCSALVKPWSW